MPFGPLRKGLTRCTYSIVKKKSQQGEESPCGLSVASRFFNLRKFIISSEAERWPLSLSNTSVEFTNWRYKKIWKGDDKFKTGPFNHTAFSINVSFVSRPFKCSWKKFFCNYVMFYHWCLHTVFRYILSASITFRIVGTVHHNMHR